MAYDNIQFPLLLDRLISQFTFDTTVIPFGNGGEVRIANWDDAQLTFNALAGVRSLADLRALAVFQILRRGRARSFPVRDLLDQTQSPFNDGSLMALDVAGNGTAGPFQLTKTYADAANTWIREITKPEPGTIKLYVATVLQVEGTAYTLNYLTGKITWLSGHFPAVAALIEWEGRYFVPARFVDDKLPLQDIALVMKTDSDGNWTQIKTGTVELPEILLIEDRDA